MIKRTRDRDCGDCIVCCVYQGIKELDKGAMVHCPHVRLPGPTKKNQVYYTGVSTNGNCKIDNSDSRPECCSGYKCLWLMGFGNEDDRPDKVLMLFDYTHRIENAAEGKPLKDGQEETEVGRQVIDRMSVTSGKPVVVTTFYERRIKRVAGRAISNGHNS